MRAITNDVWRFRNVNEFESLYMVICSSYIYLIIDKKIFRSSRPGVFCKKVVLMNFANFTGKHLCESLFLIKLEAWGLQLYLKRDPVQLFSYEFCEISKNTFFKRTPPVAASEYHLSIKNIVKNLRN